MLSSDPAVCKRTVVKNYDKAAWEKKSEAVMTQCIMKKFEQNPELRNFLIATAPKQLLEANPRDLIWGIGLGLKDPDIENKDKWGKNLCGHILMEVRRKLSEHN
jgi:hypothetical protein